MLTRADFGLSITGRVDSITPVEFRSGISKGKDKNGVPYEKPWSFYAQTVSLACAGAMYDIMFRQDQDPKADMFTGELDQIVRIRVGPPTVYKEEVNFAALMG